MIFFQNSAKETGNLLFFKYRAKDASTFQVFTSSSYSTPNGNHNFMYTLELDGEWHIAVIKAKNISADDSGKMIAKHLRFDVEGAAGAWAEFAYVGYAEKIEDIIEYVNGKDTAENIKAYCSCPSFAQVSTDGGLVECLICNGKAALELPYVGPQYRWTLDRVAGTASSGMNGYKVIANGSVADGYLVNVSFSGWLIAEYGCKEYAYRIVVDGVPGEWVYFAGNGRFDSGVANAMKGSYPTWDWENETSGPAFNCRFENNIVLDMAALHGKNVNVEVTAINNMGAYMPIVIIADILPEHGGRGGYEYIDDDTHGVKCTGCGEIWTVEKHTDAPQGEAVYVDKNTHKVVCACEGVEFVSAHVGATVGVWNEALGRYESDVPCTSCGEKYDTVYKNWIDYSVHADGKTFGSTGGGTSHIVTGGVLVMKPNGNTTWGGVSVGQVPASVGRYYVLKYRVTALAAAADTVKITIRFNNQNITVAVDATEGWHTIVLDLATYCTDEGNGMVSTLKGSDPDHWFINNADANMISYEVAFEGFADRLEGIPDDVCTCPEFAHVPVGEDVCEVVCAICGATIKSFAAHDNAELAYVQPDCVNDGHTAGTECKNCGYQTYTVIPSTGTHAGGSDNEYCKGCKTFINASPADCFDAVLGLTWRTSNEHMSSWDINSGYMVYTKVTSDGSNGTTDTSAFSGETGQYLVMKYRATGDAYLQFYTSTVKTSADGAYYAAIKDLTHNGWSYYIVDLSKAVSGNGIKAADGTVDGKEAGKYYITHFRFDVEADTAGSSIEIAFIAFDNSVEDIIAGIKAIEGVTNVKPAYCPCGDMLAGDMVYQDTQYHAQTCKLCGTVTTMAHTNANVATWNADNSRYETTCTICNGLVVNPFQTTVNADFAGWGAAVNGGWHKYDSTTNGVRQFGPNSASGYGVSISNPGTAGRYYILKYRVPAEAIQDGASVETATSVNIQIRFNGTGKVVTLKADDKWHIMVIDVATDWNLTVTNGRVTYTDYWFLMGSMYNSYKYFEVEYFGWTEFLDRLPADLVSGDVVCDCTTAGFACVYVDANNHATVCSVCGTSHANEAHAATVTVKAAVLPTCTTAGSSVEKACKCGITMIESKTVPARHMATGAITSVEDGKYYSTCDCGEKVEMYLDSIWDTDNLLDQGIKTYVTCDLVDGGVRYTNTTNGDAAIVSFENNNVPGRYFIIKYRAGNLSTLDIYMSTEATTANGSYHTNPLVNSDGNWHILIVDGVKSAGFVANGDGTYTVHQLRIDIENNGGAKPWLEVAYWGFAHSADQIKNLLTADGDLDDYKTECTHVIQTTSWIDTATHAGVCSICGVAGTATAHTTSVYGVWDEEVQSYVDTCTVCNGKAAVPFNVTLRLDNNVSFPWCPPTFTVTKGAEYATIKAAEAPRDDYHVMLPNGEFGTTHITGKYLVFKYRVTNYDAEATEFAIQFNTMTTQGATAYGWCGVKVPVSVADGWHVAIVDIDSFNHKHPTNGTDLFVPDANGDYYAQFLSIKLGNANVYEVQIEYAAMFDSMEHLQAAMNNPVNAAYKAEVLGALEQ